MSTPLTTFIHPQKVYRLQHPAEWEQVIQEEGRSCGFGPRERDDVGLWISIMPFSLDTDRLTEDLGRMWKECLAKHEADNLRKDPTLRHYGLKADMKKETDAGHYWLLAGGDIVLFASSQVPPAERDVWNPLFDALMASLLITRDDELLARKAANEVLEGLRKRFPDQDFHMTDKGIQGKDRSIHLGNLYREVRASPKRREAIVKNFVAGLAQSVDSAMGHEVWSEIIGQVLPVLKPVDYIVPNTPTQHLHTSEWLAEVVICYVIKNQKFFRFITGWDLRRWEIDAETLHQRALENLANLPWPSRLEGSRGRDGGRVILIDTKDDLASSRLLHPSLHKLLSGPLGSPFWAGIPNRSALVVFSDRRSLKQRIGRQLKKDHHGSAYPISPRAFLVTPDGIAPGPD